VASVALAGLLASLASAQTQRVSWDEKAPYADRMMYNGQRYKTIQVTDKINVWASMNHTSTLTVANVVITNEGKERFDVDPERFICVCTSPKQKVLKHDWPFGLGKNTTLQILRANTVLPGSDLKGMVSFERIRRCDAIRLVIIVQNVAFEFPFTHAGGASGNMN
jgi:peptidyl-tRNA hydrolase